LKPASIYGGAKLASEALMTSYAYNYGFETVIYRLANMVGSMARHGLSATSLGSCWKTLRNSRFLEMEPGKVMSTR